MLSLTIVKKGSSLTVVNGGLLLTIINEGSLLIIINEMTSFIKTIVFQTGNHKDTIS